MGEVSHLMNIFEITIQRQSKLGWPVVVTQTARSDFLPIRHEGILNFSSDYLTQLYRLQTQPKAYGTLLGKALFQDNIRDAFVKAFDNSKDGLRILLHVEDDQLKSKIAWQQLCVPINGNWDFLALNQQLPLSLYLPSNTDRHFPPIGKRDLNALILVASPQDINEYRLHPFNVEETVKTLKTALGKIPTDILANIADSVGKPTLDNLCRQLTQKRYTLLHIVCHGHLNSNGETLVYWADNRGQVDPFSGTKLIERLQRQSIQGLPYFVFLSTCESANKNAEASLGGLAQRMVKELGMPAVIAMTQKISIKTAGFLSTEFYQRLRDRGEVDVALVEATSAYAERYDILVPALFSRLRGQPLFDDVLDRDLNNTDIEYGLSRLPSLLEARSPILIQQFTPINTTLQKTLKTQPQALNAALKEERQNALTELNSLCDRILEISFNALALDQTPPIYDPRCPFQGLYPFKPENQEFFFGRDRLIAELKQTLAHEHFLAVVGKSGCGKSSIVLAGLVPALQKQQPELQLVDIMPGQNPFEHLLAGLSLIQNQPCIIVVDQFEELFTLCQDKLKRVQLIEKLIQLTQTHKVVITLREDFLTECAVYPELRQRLETRLKIITPMQPEELRGAMEQQAAQVGLQFEASVSAAIFGDVKDEPGAMPLLQHALRELWKRRHGRWLLYQEYEEIGTVKQAIARTADEFYHQLSPQEQQQVKDIFLRLTRLDQHIAAYPERLDTRRRVEMENLVPLGGNIAVTKDLVRRLANEDARLVVTSRNSFTGQEEVEVAHEALIRYWSKLQEWLNTDRDHLQSRERIRQQAEDWKQEDKDELLLLKGGRLEDAEKLLCNNPQFFNQQEADYIQACSRKQRQEVQTLRKSIAALTAALVVAVGAGVFAARQMTIANLLLDAEKVEDLLDSDPVEALMLAIQATGESHRKLGKVLPEVQASLHAAIQVPVEKNVFVQENRQAVNSVVFSPDGKIIASGNDDGTIDLRDLQGDLIVPPLKGTSETITSLVFSRDGSIASGSTDGIIELWDLKENHLSQAFQAHEGEILSVAFSPDGKTIVSGGSDKTIRLWNLQGKQISEPFQGHDDWVWSVAFSPDGKTIVSGSHDNRVRLWNLQGNPIGEPFQGHEEAIISLAFSPDGKTIVSGSRDSTIRLWDLQGKQISEPFQGHDDWVYSVNFSPDGTLIATSSRDHTVRLWDVHSHLAKQFIGHLDQVWSVAFSPDGKTIVSGSRDHTVRLWNLQGDPIGEPFRGHEDFVYSVNFSPDGKTIVSGSRDHTVRLWNLQGDPIGEPFRGHEDFVYSVNFSPDGKTIVSGSRDHTVRLWNLQGDPIGEPFRGHEKFISSVTFSPDGERILSSSGDNTIRLWDLQGNPIGEPFRGHNHFVKSALFSFDRKIIVSGSRDHTVRLWNLQGDPIGEPFRGHEGTVYSAVFSPDQKMIISGGYDKKVRLLDLQGNQIGEFKGHTNHITSVSINDNGTAIISADKDNMVRLWKGGNWNMWLQIACDQLQEHDVFIQPQTQLELNASKICIKAKKYYTN